MSMAIFLYDNLDLADYIIYCHYITGNTAIRKNPDIRNIFLHPLRISYSGVLIPTILLKLWIVSKSKPFCISETGFEHAKGVKRS